MRALAISLCMLASAALAGDWTLLSGEEIKAALDDGLAQVRGVPLFAVSAKTGKGLDTMLGAAFEIRESWSKRVPTSALNRRSEERRVGKECRSRW